MATTYTKSLASDFGGELNPYQLQVEITKSAIATAISHITTNDDVVHIVFNSALSGGDVTLLNTLISAHVSVISASKYVIATLTPRTNTVSSTSYKRVASFGYKGTLLSNPITEVTLVSYMDSSITSYSVRLIALTQPSIMICEQTFNNTAETTNSITNISNLPSTPIGLEFQVKKTGGNNQKYVYVDSITLITS